MDSVWIVYEQCMKNRKDMGKNREIKRICVYPKDIQRITGKSYRQSARLLSNIRKELQKRPNGLITVMEFCEYTDLKIEQVAPHIT